VWGKAFYQERGKEGGARGKTLRAFLSRSENTFQKTPFLVLFLNWFVVWFLVDVLISVGYHHRNALQYTAILTETGICAIL
jgi:fluoride ion exporter CrcB/FEX